MQLRSLAKQTLITLLGLSLLGSGAAEGLETVSFYPSSSFILNPTVGNPNQVFGTINIRSDSSAGWVLQVRSLNSSTIRDAVSGATIQYSLRVDGNVVNNLSSGNSVTVMSTSTLTCNGVEGCTYVIEGTLLAGHIDGKAAATYTDTLTFTLTNNP